jgi:hypothetical protein
MFLYILNNACPWVSLVSGSMSLAEVAMMMLLQDVLIVTCKIGMMFSVTPFQLLIVKCKIGMGLSVTPYQLLIVKCKIGMGLSVTPYQLLIVRCKIGMGLSVTPYPLMIQFTKYMYRKVVCPAAPAGVAVSVQRVQRSTAPNTARQPAPASGMSLVRVPKTNVYYDKMYDIWMYGLVGMADMMLQCCFSF